MKYSDISIRFWSILVIWIEISVNFGHLNWNIRTFLSDLGQFRSNNWYKLKYSDSFIRFWSILAIVIEILDIFIRFWSIMAIVIEISVNFGHLNWNIRTFLSDFGQLWQLLLKFRSISVLWIEIFGHFYQILVNFYWNFGQPSIYFPFQPLPVTSSSVM